MKKYKSLIPVYGIFVVLNWFFNICNGIDTPNPWSESYSIYVLSALIQGLTFGLFLLLIF